MNISQKLTRFARGREKALRAKGLFDAGKAKAVTKIKIVAGYCANMNPQKQLAMVGSIEDPIMELIPSELSTFQNLRAEMLELLDRAKS